MKDEIATNNINCYHLSMLVIATTSTNSNGITVSKETIDTSSIILLPYVKATNTYSNLI